MAENYPVLPRMFRPDSFPSFLTFEEGPEYDAPSSLAGREIEPPAALFNRAFNSAVGGWGLPPPEIEDGTDGDVGQSEAEIVQQIYLKPRAPCQQFEMFFTAAPLFTKRNVYGQTNRVPYEGLTLNEIQQFFIDTNPNPATQFEYVDDSPNHNVRREHWNAEALSIAQIVRRYNPTGFFFAYVEDRLKNQSGMDVAYTCGSLCDILNVWHVPIVPGMQLYIVLMWVCEQTAAATPRKMFVPFASLGRPEEDPALMRCIANNSSFGDRAKTEFAVIDIGTVCVASNQPPQMLPGHAFVGTAGSLVPTHKTSSMSMTTDPVQIKHNILRVNVNMLRWEYHPSV
jgi:hypothetical protein